MAVSTSRIANGGRRGNRSRESQSAVARMPPRLSLGWPHSAASQVSLKSSQRIIVPMLNAACTGSSWKLVPGTRAPLGTIGPRNDGAEQLGACRIFERLEAAAQRVDQAITRCGVGEIALDLEIQRVVGDVGEDFVRRGAFIADVRRHAGSFVPIPAPQSAQTSDSPAQYRWPTGE